ncbi:MAG: hypothetical protein ACO3YY_06715 [Phycisphaerales bacterium]
MPGGSKFGAAAGGAATAQQYRFRTASGVSGWMSGEEVRAAAMRGELAPDDQIQLAGRADWVDASVVKGLEFPSSEPAGPTTGAATGHHIKFSTLKEVLGTFLHAEVEVRLGRESRTMSLDAVGQDHFEATDEGEKRRYFVPFARVLRVVAEETSAGKALNYRDAHRLSIVADGDG